MSDNVNEIKKIDFFSVLKRRKRTVEDFVKEHNITSSSVLFHVIKTLSKEYYLSAEFISEVSKLVPQEIIIEEEKEQQKDVVEEINEAETFKPEQKTKKRVRKQN